MNNKVKFSIVVPIYNVEAYLEKCVHSILGQTYKEFELILVDDGSTDKCARLCDEYKEIDNRIRVIHKKNGGLVSARKAGIRIANGDYAICVDSDDWISEFYLEKIASIIENNSPDVICFRYTEINADNKTESLMPYKLGFYTKDQIRSEIFPWLIYSNEGKGFPPAIWAKVYKMNLYREEQLLVDDKIKIGEDAACTIPCIYKAQSIYITDECLYFYRRNNLSMTKNRKPFLWNGPELICRHHKGRISEIESDLYEQINRRTVHALINVTKTQFYRNEPYRTITKDIKEQLKRPIYFTAIRNSKFKRFTPIHLCSFFLKKHIFFPFWVLSKLK